MESATALHAEMLPDDLEDEEPLEIPAERRRVKTDKQDLPVDTLCTRIERGKIDLQPEFQRNFVWSATKASRLIESLLLEIPIPVVYMAEEEDKTFSVVDGQQRLTAISSFVNGKFPDGADFHLSGLQVMTELNGRAFRQLPSDLQDKISSSAMRVIIIQQGSHPDVKFEVFERLNLGAEKLNDMELRNCVFRGSYNDLLRELAANHNLLKIRGKSVPDIRMRDRQLILRFFAMWRNTHLRYTGPMKRFMNREIEHHRELSPLERREMTEVFERSIELAYTVFGRHAFHRFNPGTEKVRNGSWEENKLNIALWDTLLYTFSYYQKRDIVPVADRVREEFLDVMTNDDQFVLAISRTTDKPSSVQYRASVWRQRLDALVGPPSHEPRAFSFRLKRALYEAEPTCALCNQRIHDLDDAEVDHIEHYWRGGKTIPENARLAHRYCNRARGGR